MTDRPHLWVPYPYMPGEAAICTLCGEFQTPENAAGECAEPFMGDDLAAVPADIPSLAWPADLDPAEGADDEMRQGAVIPP
jgi:hypothetical protein